MISPSSRRLSQACLSRLDFAVSRDWQRDWLMVWHNDLRGSSHLKLFPLRAALRFCLFSLGLALGWAIGRGVWG